MVIEELKDDERPKTIYRYIESEEEAILGESGKYGSAVLDSANVKLDTSVTLFWNRECTDWRAQVSTPSTKEGGDGKTLTDVWNVSAVRRFDYKEQVTKDYKIHNTHHRYYVDSNTWAFCPFLISEPVDVYKGNTNEKATYETLLAKAKANTLGSDEGKSYIFSYMNKELYGVAIIPYKHTLEWLLINDANGYGKGTDIHSCIMGKRVSNENVEEFNRARNKYPEIFAIALDKANEFKGQHAALPGSPTGMWDYSKDTSVYHYVELSNIYTGSFNTTNGIQEYVNAYSDDYEPESVHLSETTDTSIKFDCGVQDIRRTLSEKITTLRKID